MCKIAGALAAGSAFWVQTRTETSSVGGVAAYGRARFGKVIWAEYPGVAVPFDTSNQTESETANAFPCGRNVRTVFVLFRAVIAAVFSVTVNEAIPVASVVSEPGVV